jgi:hypothetical protein
MSNFPETVIGLAANFVGTNNINLLEPIGLVRFFVTHGTIPTNGIA